MKFVPYDKLSKKKKREADRARRGNWGGLNPVTRRPEDPKAYKRSERKSEWKKARLPDDGETGLFNCRQIVRRCFDKQGESEERGRGVPFLRLIQAKQEQFQVSVLPIYAVDMLSTA
jgi:hypothetical protein